MNSPKVIAFSSLAVLIALYVVGAVSNGSLRHEVQTLPLWVPIVLGFRRQEAAKWTAIPCLIIWLTLMILIWLFLLGWARVLSGHFSPVEIILTMLIGVASLIGLTASFRWPTRSSWSGSLAMMALMSAFQLLALRISFLPYIARR